LNVVSGAAYKPSGNNPDSVFYGTHLLRPSNLDCKSRAEAYTIQHYFNCLFYCRRHF